ncbi:hypothetical protein AB0K09_08170 [Streptomyces sp. NPDC049577]|uniref:hypothetical protein n=1 Tax=Streptomyces sp. NPDC049577 TaxID=3155153 RepID=UPI00342FB895
MTGPAGAPPAYRAVFCDLRSDQVLDTLPLTEVQYDDYIGKPGSLTATIPLPDAALAQRARAALEPGRTAVWLERGTEIWWGGILWTCTPAGDERGRAEVQIQAGTFDSYLDHRILSSDLNLSGDQFDLVRRILDHIQGVEGGDIGLVYGTEASGVNRTRSFAMSDVARVREILDTLAAMDDGFEWRVHCYRDTQTGARVKQLQLGHPVIRTGATDIVLDRPGPVLSYSLPSDATVQANAWQSRGASVNRNQARESAPLLSRPLWNRDDILVGGWPRLDGTSDYSDISDQALLDAHALADWRRAARPQVIPEITVRVDGRITPALLGSALRLRMHDLWHAEGSDTRFRIVGLAVTPPSRGQAETAKLYLEKL